MNNAFEEITRLFYIGTSTDRMTSALSSSLSTLSSTLLSINT